MLNKINYPEFRVMTNSKISVPKNTDKEIVNFIKSNKEEVVDHLEAQEKEHRNNVYIRQYPEQYKLAKETNQNVEIQSWSVDANSLGEDAQGKGIINCVRYITPTGSTLVKEYPSY